MEEKTFFITRDAAPGVLSLARRRMFAQFVQVHENIWFGRSPETDVDPVLGLEITRALILPPLLEAGIIKESEKGYSTDYRYIQLDAGERQVFLEGMIPISESIAMKALAKPELKANASYIKGIGKREEVNRLFALVVDCFRKLHEVEQSSDETKNIPFELGYVSIRNEQRNEGKQ